MHQLHTLDARPACVQIVAQTLAMIMWPAGTAEVQVKTATDVLRSALRLTVKTQRLKKSDRRVRK